MARFSITKFLENIRSLGSEQRTVTAEDVYGPGWKSSKSSASISATTSLEYPAVWAAIRLLSNTIAALPFEVIQRKETYREVATGHRLYRLIHSEPNGYMTSYTYRQVLMTDLLLHGNAFVRIRRSGNEITALEPIDPSTVQVYKLDGKLYYKAGDEKLQDYEIIHCKGLMTLDGIIGLSPIKYASKTISASLNAQDYSEELMSNGITATGVIEMDGLPKADQLEDLRKNMVRQFRGDKKTNSSGIAVLYGGMKFNRIAIPPVDAQFLEQRKFGVTDIARIFGLPPHMLADLERATFSNIENQLIEFITFSLLPWAKSLEQEHDRKLFTGRDKHDYGVKIFLEGLLRGDIASRTQHFHTMVLDGIMTRNEVRALENMKPIAGGDIPLVPVNQTTIENIQKTDEG